MKEFTDKQKLILRQVEKLMAKAAGNTTEHEAAAATELAQSLLAKYNLTQEDISGGDRSDERILGGSLQYERDLWRAIAHLNFCWYYTVEVVFKTEEERKKHRGRKKSRHHRLIGRTVNIMGSKMMAEYLMTTLERLTREYCVENFGEYKNRSADATAFREGATRRLIQRIEYKRDLLLREESEAARRAEERATAARRDGASVALTLTSLTKSEFARNYDFLYGEGAYDKATARAEAWEREQEELRKQREAWARAHPEEAARLEARALREAVKEARRAEKREEKAWAEEERRAANPAFRAGLRRGAEIGLDAQVSGGSAKVRGALGSGE